MNLLTFVYYVCFFCKFYIYIEFTFTFDRKFICCKLFSENKLLTSLLSYNLLLSLMFINAVV